MSDDEANKEAHFSKFMNSSLLIWRDYLILHFAQLKTNSISCIYRFTFGTHLAQNQILHDEHWTQLQLYRFFLQFVQIYDSSESSSDDSSFLSISAKFISLVRFLNFLLAERFDFLSRRFFRRSSLSLVLRLSIDFLRFRPRSRSSRLSEFFELELIGRRNGLLSSESVSLIALSFWAVSSSSSAPSLSDSSPVWFDPGSLILELEAPRILPMNL